ncbi:DNA repair metallo-beta-lactamase protein, putative [Plasmodium berghei]|uniref:DNA repair metallo-beta-lactamase protein, putative n=2 Tax=Plasmodium berghei TaxID=5821 RepID=A0A509AP21_PLABA|nr:DNA repair metallo-beta-lactamase protein, putative [Plasmodium berghei ANKA]CXI87670.1 DNA repair metallo-beta-lactamase protein, putative [Plasmodium berghei]SCL95825.1 DNA repair metallo-beta-lactamase protein, putative [Plasmodium berghei]SCM16294.1 DNA repair metallo-beta-lactamase protein, putative [Plasmodium berghei]SCM18090.1 DNA repair metallo-beta-lactamase protein, putative [Plasmodium berghei]SCN27516.1 DNA repair metallo-beta-lactamase protein, putative [Plasmodium berghei]|eukprot:XP_034423172.1 DNA repair metallo-beta-lactamase protein, putative [Plasmodium berghei ANKA]
MIEDDIHIIANDPLIIIDKFPYIKKKSITPGECDEKKEITKVYFLTHFHADHYMNINKNFNENIFSSTITKKLLINIIGVDEKYVHNLKVNKNYYLFNFEIILIDANHCPGSVIIYFEFSNGTKIIHTGDFRYSNVHTLLIKKILSSNDPVKIYEYNSRKRQFIDKYCTEESSNKLVGKREEYEWILWNNKKYNNCYMNTPFKIYNSNTYVVSIDEFRLMYLKGIEDLLWKLQDMKTEFYVYDSIERENYFNYFIFVELSLYFNQNNTDIMLMYGNNTMLNDDVIINKDNLKNIRFVLNYDTKDYLDKTPCYGDCYYEKEQESHVSKQKYNNITVKHENYDGENNISTNGNCNSVKINIKREVSSSKEARCCNSYNKKLKGTIVKTDTKKKMNNSYYISKFEVKKNKNGQTHINELKENMNYIKTIYLDTTYAMSKNMFAHQMYLINFIIYICKNKIKQNYKVDACKDENCNFDNLSKIKNSINNSTQKSKDNNTMKNGDDSATENGLSWMQTFKGNSTENKLPLMHVTQRKRKKTLFMFGTYNLGKEKVYLSVSEACNMKIYFRNPKKKIIFNSYIYNKDMLNRITGNKLEAEIHIVDINYSYIFPKIEKNKLRSLIDAEMEDEFDSFYYIIPTGWVKNYYFYEKNNMSVFLIPYSEHSNLDELKDFVKSIKPCSICPTVFSNIKEKNRMLNIFNPYLNLKQEAYDFLKPKNELRHIKNKKIAKIKKEKLNEKKKINKHKTKAEKIRNDRYQQKLTYFFSLTKSESIKKCN